MKNSYLLILCLLLPIISSCERGTDTQSAQTSTVQGVVASQQEGLSNTGQEPAKMAGDNKTITISADEWYPYNGDPLSSKPGFMIEIAQTIFNEAGYEVKYQVQPWARAIIDTRAGKFNAIVGGFYEDAPDFIYPDQEIAVSTSAFYVKKGEAWQYTDFSSITEVTLGLIKDYSWGEEVDNYALANVDNPEKVQFVYGADPLTSNIKKLLAGRITTFMEDRAVTKAALKDLGLSDQVVEAGIYSTDKSYIAFSPAIAESKKYAKILSDGMVKLRESGRLESILNKYGLTDWHESGADKLAASK